VAVAASCLQSGYALAHSHKQKGLEIVHPWCFETADASVKTNAVYMLIKNLTKRADRLIGASSTRARKIEIRESTGEATAPTRAISGVTIKGGQEAALKRAGPYLLLSGLAKPLGPYDSFLMTLVFERAGKIEVEVVVEEATRGDAP
jgi:copper(I)-binding protein